MPSYKTVLKESFKSTFNLDCFTHSTCHVSDHALSFLFSMVVANSPCEPGTSVFPWNLLLLIFPYFSEEYVDPPSYLTVLKAILSLLSFMGILSPSSTLATRALWPLIMLPGVFSYHSCLSSRELLSSRIKQSSLTKSSQFRSWLSQAASFPYSTRVFFYPKSFGTSPIPSF